MNKSTTFAVRCFVLSLALAPAAASQVAVYDTTEGTSLTYREVTRTHSQVKTPDGPMPSDYDHDAVIALTFTADGRAEASYLSLEIASETDRGREAPDTGSVLGQPFTLEISPRGHVVTTATPAFPPSFDAITDLRWQFFDFFVPLPDVELAPGLAWTDSLETHTDGHSVIHSGRYEVLGDTVIAGVPAVTISAEVRKRIESSTPDEVAPGVTLTSSVDGVEHGLAYFALQTGRLLGRRRSAELQGELKFVMRDQSITMPQWLRYENSLELIEE